MQEVKPRTVPVEFEYPAQTAGSREVEVRARVTGILMKRNYVEGALVQAPGSRSSSSIPRPTRPRSRAPRPTSPPRRRASAPRSRNAKRLKPLFEAKAVSQKDYDDAISGEEVAAADVKAARARLNEARLNLELDAGRVAGLGPHQPRAEERGQPGLRARRAAHHRDARSIRST